MSVQTPKARPGRPYTLLGPDRRPYPSRTPGRYGGYRPRKLCGRLDCPSALWAIARGGYVQHRVFFADEATAIAAGYRPCAVCLPAQHAAWKAAGKAAGAALSPAPAVQRARQTAATRCPGRKRRRRPETSSPIRARAISAARGVARTSPPSKEGTREMTTANPPYELKQVDTSAGRMAYRETGSPDAPVALYVHGVIINGHLWRHQLEAFTDIRRNLAVDLLGHGHSVAAAADIDAYVTPYVTCPAQLQDLERFILAFDPAQTIRIHDRLEQLTTPTAIV
jgi:hypothetical protein